MIGVPCFRDKIAILRPGPGWTFFPRRCINASAKAAARQLTCAPARDEKRNQLAVGPG